MITLLNISKTYTLKNESFQALNDVSLHIDEQEIIGIVGLSGAGKSTLVRCMNGLIKPTSGQVIIDGINIHDLKQEDLNRMRHDISMIFQHFNLVSNLTVFQNIKLALNIKNSPKNLRDQKVMEALDLVGLSDKKNRYPKELSGGEKQRVGIARAIVNQPKYLLCDEATSGLDQKTAYDIVSLLKEIHQKTKITIVFITHQIEIIKDLCNRVVVMDQGKIIEDRSTKDLFINPFSDITKSLIKQVIDEPTHLKDKHYLELIYHHEHVNDTILSQMIKTYDIDVNIHFAKTLTIGSQTIGYLYLEMIGNHKTKAIEYLRSNDIEVKEYA
ncbi:MAG: ATP-binding cassette domain-containing protein [Acholeplasmataceae bacterium]|nr:ATP-binding cassette domain-containing protein [Acholeplasmataceae bacterium]